MDAFKQDTKITGLCNPDVRADTIEHTICRKGDTKTVRLATSYRDEVKFGLMRKLETPQSESSLWVLDHIVALIFGGHPKSLANFQILSGSANSRKSRIEAKLSCFVCSGQMPLSQAQAEVAEDWEATYHRYAKLKCRK